MTKDERWRSKFDVVCAATELSTTLLVLFVTKILRTLTLSCILYRSSNQKSMSAFIRTAVLRTKATVAVAMESLTLPIAAAPKLRFRGARKRLMQHGLNALLPTAQIKHPECYPTGIDVKLLPGSERSWKSPLISKRRAAMLRKDALRSGTYGVFDSEKGGLGWDPAWDVELAKANPSGLGRYTAMRVPKKASRRRTREARAQKIEAALVGMDERMEEMQAAKHRNKPPVTFESTYKKLMRAKKK
jgi:hypothetical protein